MRVRLAFDGAHEAHVLGVRHVFKKRLHQMLDVLHAEHREVDGRLLAGAALTRTPACASGVTRLFHGLRDTRGAGPALAVARGPRACFDAR